MKCDILAFGIHPDDLEIGIFGTLALEIKKGKKIILVDLTNGEMGSNGSVEQRKSEAQKASEIIGCSKRYSLGLKDRGIIVDEHSIIEVVKVIRKHQPEFVLFPYHTDYHPDHENGSRLIKEAIHSSGLSKLLIEGFKLHKVNHYGMYYINDVKEPNTYIDITETFEQKMEALLCHESQFIARENSIKTYLNSDFLELLKSRDRYFGSLCGCLYAEAICKNKIKPHKSLVE